MVVEDGLRERHARQITVEKMADVIRNLKSVGVQSDLQTRRYVQCKSGIAEEKYALAFVDETSVVSKCISVFAGLTQEVDLLLHEAHTKMYNMLLLYCEDVVEGFNTPDRVAIVRTMSTFLPALYELSAFVDRCYEIGRNIVQQLQAVFNLLHVDFPNARDRQLTRCWLCLGDVLSILMTLDEIIRVHPSLKDHWRVFVESIQVVEHNCIKFGLAASAASKTKLRSLFTIIDGIQRQVIDGAMLENFCHLDFGALLLDDRRFLDRLQVIITDALARWDRLACEDMPDKQRIILITCLTVFCSRLTSRGSTAATLLDKKLAKALWETQKRLLTFYFVGDMVWTPLDFLTRVLSEDVLTRAGWPKKPHDLLRAAQATLFEKQIEALPKEMETINESAAAWKSEIRRNVELPFPDTSKSHAATTARIESGKQLPTVRMRCVCVLKGARIADRAMQLIKYVLNACLADDRTLAKSNALQIFRLIEVVNMIANTLNFHWPSVLEWTAHARVQYSGRLLALLASIREQFTAGAQRDDRRVIDVSAALRDAVITLSGAPTRRSLIRVALALDVADYQKAFRPAELTRADELLSRLDALTNVGLLLSRVCDTSYLFWHRSLVGVYFENASISSNWPIEGVKFFFDALNQCCISPMLSAVRHCQAENLRAIFQRTVFAAFKEVQSKFLLRLCTDVETNLRLSCHRRLEIEAAVVEAALFPADGGRRTVTTPTLTGDEGHVQRLVEFLRPADSFSDRSLELRLGDRLLNVREHVSSQLNAAFYNLTTVALHDGEIYARMRTLARQRFALDALDDAHLPLMKVDQGADVVMIARNIHLFVEQYAYDLIEQMFIERFNNSRALNVVQAEQIVNSVRTHGAGILNTMVDVIYQFLRRSFHVFSQFLHDERVKSLLVKEIRYYRDHIDQLNHTLLNLLVAAVQSDLTKLQYPMERADALNALISKIGGFEGEKSFLEKFRELITQIGNAVGLIRMFRTGLWEALEYAAPFVKRIDVDALRELAHGAGDTPFAVGAAEILTGLIANVGDSFAHNSAGDFVDKLIGVFAREFRSDRYAHLRNFFILIPALSVNHAEHIFACQNRLGKQRATANADFTFVDDGFCFGTAYILRVLNQGFFFDSLNWFDAVRATHAAQIGGATSAAQAAQQWRVRDESLAQTLALKLARVSEFAHKYHHFEHTFTTALIFFRVKEFDNSQSADDLAKEDAGETFLEEF